MAEHADALARLAQGSVGLLDATVDAAADDACCAGIRRRESRLDSRFPLRVDTMDELSELSSKVWGISEASSENDFVDIVAFLES